MHAGKTAFVVVAGLAGAVGIAEVGARVGGASGAVAAAWAEPDASASVVGARAEEDASASVVVPLVGAGGRPVFCGHNLSGGRAQPQDEGGYRVIGLAPGRHVVHFELTSERIDVLVTVAPGEDVVVPPVVVLGVCRELSLRAPLIDVEPRAELPAWTLRIGRRYQARAGMQQAVFDRDRGLMKLGAARRALRRADKLAQSRGL